MPKLEHQTITDFSPGLNLLADERVILPNAQGEPAESPYMENVEITSKGAIVTSPGFELVSAGTGTAGCKNLMLYEKDPTTRYLITATDDDYWSINPSSSVWAAVGDYGTASDFVGGVTYKGSSSTRRAILGTDNAANDIKKWDGTTFAGLGGSPPKGWIMETWMGMLFVASGMSVYYSAVDNEGNWTGGVIGFDDTVTGLKAQGDYLFVHMRRETQPVQMYYNDSFSLSAPLKKPLKYATGCLAHKTIESVYNDFYLLTPDGIQRFGSDPQFIASNTRINSLSWKIDPALLPKNYNPLWAALAVGKYFDKKYYLSLPYDSDTFNSKTFVYDWRYDSWTTRSGFYPAGYAIMPDSNNRDELYFASALEPKIFKFNDSFNYAGDGYERKYTTKVFVFGGSMVNKFYQYIDLRGSMYTNTVFYVDITVDGTTKTYKVDSNALETSSTGGYYGDDTWGSTLYGGGFESQFKRFGVRLPFPMDIRDGRELQVTIRNDGAGQPWKVDYMDIAYSFDALEKVDYKFQSATLI